MKQQYKKIDFRRGAALLVVLFIVMAITILSLGFLSRCDTELACGQNTLLHEQMDSLAYSGLEHARGLILYPQDLPTTKYWEGASGQWLTAGNDYYDVTVVMHDAVNDPDPTYRCTYNINCKAYHLKDGVRTGNSVMQAELRLDPCIAYWTDVDITVPSRMYVYGDTRCGGNLLNLGTLRGDVFALSLNGTANGQTKMPAELAVLWPNVAVANFTSVSNYSVQAISANLSTVLYEACSPPKVYNCNGPMNIQGGVTINGMLVVQGDLYVSGLPSYIVAGKNLPALYVTGDLIIMDDAQLNITGLAVVDNRVRIGANAGDVNVYGGLFAKNGLFETAADSTTNADTALLHNGPTWRPTGGHLNGAIELDGVDDFLQTANNNDLVNLRLTGDYTFSVWVKADPIQKASAGIFAKCSADGLTNYWTLQFDPGGSRLIVCHPGGFWDTDITLDDIKNGAWHNIIIVRSGETMLSYLDAVEKKNQTWSVAPGSGNGHLNIGVDRTASSACTFRGSIDELKVYKAAASGALDANLPASSDLLGYWAFDKSNNGTVNIYASPDKAAVLVWDNTNTPATQVRWGQAGGAFYRSIKR